MELRDATHPDIANLCELFLRLKRMGPYALQPHDLDRARSTMRRCISSPQGYFKVLEVNGELRGGLMGVVEEFWWSGRRYASDLAIFSQMPRGGELLVRDFCTWAWKQRAVIEVLIGQSSGDSIDATHNLFTSMGFEHAGGLYRLTRYEALGAVA